MASGEGPRGSGEGSGTSFPNISGDAFQDAQPADQPIFTGEFQSFMDAFQSGMGAASAPTNPEFAAGVGEVFKRGILRVQAELLARMEAQAADMERQFKEAMDAQAKAFHKKQEELLREQQGRKWRQQRERPADGGSDSNESSDSVVPDEERPYIPLNDIRVPSEKADISLLNSGVRRMIERHCPPHWGWNKLDSTAKMRLLIRVKGAFKNGNKFNQDFLKEKVRGTLKGMRSYTREKIRLTLMKRWNGDSAAVKKINFDHSIGKEQLDIFLLEERAVTAYLKVDNFQEKMTSLDLKMLQLAKDFESLNSDEDDQQRGTLRQQQQALRQEREPLQSQLVHWQAVYKREGPILDEQKRATERVKSVAHKNKEKSKYGQGGGSTFTSTFWKAFDRKPTPEEYEYARSNGSLKLHAKVIAELEKERRAREETERADNAAGTADPGGENGDEFAQPDENDEDSTDEDGGDHNADNVEDSKDSSSEDEDDLPAEEYESLDEAPPPPRQNSRNENLSHKQKENTKTAVRTKKASLNQQESKRDKVPKRKSAKVPLKKTNASKAHKKRTASSSQKATEGTAHNGNEERGARQDHRPKKVHTSRTMNLDRAIDGDTQDREGSPAGFRSQTYIPSPIPLASRPSPNAKTKQRRRPKHKQ